MTPDQLAEILRALGYGAYVPAILALVGLAAKVAALVAGHGGIFRHVARYPHVLDVLGGNWGNAANATAPAMSTASPVH